MAFETDSDADLLGYMAMQEDDPDGALAAWGEFFVRHRTALFRIVRESYGHQLGGDSGAGDLVAEVFRRAYARAGSFTPRSDDPDTIRRSVLAWLCRIAKRLFLDLLREDEKLPMLALVEDEDEDEAETIAVEAEESEEPKDRENERLPALRAVLEEMSERDRVVLIETMQWYDHETGKSQMPKGVASELAARLGTTTANLRKIRQRALATLQERLGVQFLAEAKR